MELKGCLSEVFKFHACPYFPQIIVHSTSKVSFLFRISYFFSLPLIYVVVNFLSQLIFIFLLFWGMVMYANEFETKEKQKLTKIKN